MKEEVIELHAIVHGHVQGVCFRAITASYAQEKGISGTVANLDDGTVEIYAQGTRESLKDLLDFLEGPKGPGKIARIIKEYKKPSQLFEGFKVVR